MELAKIFYIGSLVFNLTHGGAVDALVWAPDKSQLPGYVTSDWYYLGGTALSLTAVTITLNNWKPEKGFREFALTTAGGLVLGSMAWDWNFGQLRYGDPLYPFPDWYGGWGFRDKTERIKFDFVRLVIGVGLLTLSEL